MLGFKHSAESIAKLKLKKLTQEQKQLLSLVNKVVSQETKNKLSSSTTDFRKKNPLSSEQLNHLRTLKIKREGVPVSILNTQTNERKEFTNQTEAGKGVTRQSIYNAMLRNKPIKKIYYISKK
jgi:hypothetical protein